MQVKFIVKIHLIALADKTNSVAMLDLIQLQNIRTNYVIIFIYLILKKSY